MRRHPRRPPPAILQARVLHYAVLPRAVPFAGNRSISLARAAGPLVPLARVPRLAICMETGGDIGLTFCDGRWRYVASTTHTTVAQAKRRAERIYPGASRHWTKAHVTVADARRYLERVWGPRRCMFCLKTPLELERDGSMFSMGRGRICSSCVMDFASDLAKKLSPPASTRRSSVSKRPSS